MNGGHSVRDLHRDIVTTQKARYDGRICTFRVCRQPDQQAALQCQRIDSSRASER